MWKIRVGFEDSPMRVISEGIVFASRAGTQQSSCAFSSIAVLGNGRWLCSCRVAPEKAAMRSQTVMLCGSDDEGRTWSPPSEPLSAPIVAGKPGRFRAAGLTALGESRVLATLYWVDDSDPSRPFFNTTTQGLVDSKIFQSVSHDGGTTWTSPTQVDTSPFDQPTPITGPTLVLPNGRWACQFELNKSYDDESEWHHSSVLIFSDNHGQTWTQHVLTSDDPTNRIFYWDQRPAVLDAGRLLDVFWTYDNVAATYLNIHARESLDGGCTWSAMWDTAVPGQPAPPVALADERIAMVYVDRTATPIIKARLSSDGGRTWPASSETIIAKPGTSNQTREKASMQDAWSEMQEFSIGLPATAKLNDREFLVTYYSGPRTDETSVHWARVSL
jgi:hypothetical protein